MKKAEHRLMAALALCCAFAFAAGTLASCNRSSLSEEEISDTVKELIEASGPINEIFFGAGLPVEEHDPPQEDDAAFGKYVRVSADSPYQSVEEIKSAAEAVFTEAYLSQLYESAFEDRQDGHPRYAADSQGILTRDVAAPEKTTDQWTVWDYDSVRVKTATDTQIVVSINGTFADRTETEMIELQKENGNWRLNSPTY